MRVLALAVLIVALLGCAGGRLEREAPSGASLAGGWRLNRAASDDPQKLMDGLRSNFIKRMRARSNAEPIQDSAPGARRAGQRAQDPTRANYQEDPLMQRGFDPVAHLPALQILNAQVARSDFLTVRQDPEELTLDYGGLVRSFTPGAHSVVSTQAGVADQESGWRGKAYVIRVKPQVGPTSTEEYALSDDGAHLVVKLHAAASELPAVDLKRVYDRTAEISPRSLPTTD